MPAPVRDNPPANNPRHDRLGDLDARGTSQTCREISIRGWGPLVARELMGGPRDGTI